MVENGNSKKTWFEITHFSLTTLASILVLAVGIYVGSVDKDIEKIDEKLFKHLTNDEIHAPTQQLVNRSEFNIYQKMRDDQMNTVKESLDRIEKALETKDGH
ncbi:MAG: hypothetical protein PHG53_09590 [Phycisphaerae bacterium]|nr:hypothetical protein [Phycisphaerae bacterium]